MKPAYTILILLLLASCKPQQPVTYIPVAGNDTTRTSAREVTTTDTVDNFKPSAFWSFGIDCDSLYQPIITDLFSENTGLLAKLEQVNNRVSITADAPVRIRTVKVVEKDTIRVVVPSPMDPKLYQQAQKAKADALQATAKAENYRDLFRKATVVAIILLILLIVCAYLLFKP